MWIVLLSILLLHSQTSVAIFAWGTEEGNTARWKVELLVYQQDKLLLATPQLQKAPWLKIYTKQRTGKACCNYNSNGSLDSVVSWHS